VNEKGEVEVIEIGETIHNELPCRDCGNEDYCDGNIDEYLRLCNFYGYVLLCSGFIKK
jgi:hypothetical protein